MKRCSVVIKETQIITTMKYHLTPTRMAILFLRTINIGKDLETGSLVMGMLNCAAVLESSLTVLKS